MRCLMATGGSPHSEAALLFGAQIAARGEKPPTILTVIKSEQDRRRGDAILASARGLLATMISETRCLIRVGRTGEEIVAEASEGNYDLIIVGEREKHRLATRLFLGSTAVYVVEHAPCPVIVAKGKLSPIRRILLCDSGGMEPPLLTRFTAQLARMLQGQEEVTVLHVMSQIGAWPGIPDSQLRANAEDLMREGAPEGELLAHDLKMLDHAGMNVKPLVRHGWIVDEILTEAAQGDYHLVVIGAHRDKGWRGFLLADIARDVITRLDRPVAVVR